VLVFFGDVPFRVVVCLFLDLWCVVSLRFVCEKIGIVLAHPELLKIVVPRLLSAKPRITVKNLLGCTQVLISVFIALDTEPM
jgi:hypothetical protein